MSMNEIRVSELVSKKELRELLQGFSDLFNISIVITKPKGKPIIDYINYSKLCESFFRKSKIGLDLCTKSDSALEDEAAKTKKPIIRKCNCGGLVDAIIPIFIEGQHIANVFAGQILFEDPNLKEFRETGEKLCIENIEEYLEFVKKIKIIDKDNFKKLINSLQNYIYLIFNNVYTTHKNKYLANYYHNIFYNLPIAANLFSVDGQRLELSKYNEKMFGTYQTSFTHINDIIDLYSIQDANKIKNAFEFAKIGEESRTEVISQNEKGNFFSLMEFFSPIKDKNENVINIIELSVDITETKEREREYEKMISEISQIMEEISDNNFSIKISTNYKQENLRVLSMALNEVTMYLDKYNEDLNNLIKDLSTPSLEVMDKVIVMPLIGKLTSDRALNAMESILNKIEETKAYAGIIDITGVKIIDSAVANSLIKTMDAIKLIGAIPILSGVSSKIVSHIMHIGIKFDFITKSSLSEALKYLINKKINKKNKSSK